MAATALKRMLGRLGVVTRFRELSGFSDADLIGLYVREQDEAAFECLVRRHGPMVMGVCSRILNSRQDAEDAFQAAFLLLAQRAANLRSADAVGNWLYGVARRTALEARTMAAKRRAKESRWLPRPSLPPDPIREEALTALDEELATLPHVYRMAVVLCDLVGKTQAQAATELGLPPGTVASRLARGRAILAKRLARRGITALAGIVAVGLPGGAAWARVTPELILSTSRMAIELLAGRTLRAIVPPAIVSLMTGVSKVMLSSSAKLVVILMFAALTVGVGTTSSYPGGLLSGFPWVTEARAESNSRPNRSGVRVQSKEPEAGTGQQKKETPPAASTRAARLKSIQEEYKKANEEISKGIKDGTLKPNDKGEIQHWLDLAKKTIKVTRVLIEADPSDSVALDALIFCLNDLWGGETDPDLYKLVLKHHIKSEKIDPLLRRYFAPDDFLRTVAAGTPHAKIRLWANYHLAEKLFEAGNARDAEPLLKAIEGDATAKEIGGYGSGTLANLATHHLYEIHHLNVGQDVPEITGMDLDGKELKLSESRGKVTLLVFWAAWCTPCMNMVKHERELYERYANKPFTIVGVNGDIVADDQLKVSGPDGKPIDNIAKVREAIQKNGIKWRSFRNGSLLIANDWNVRSWPTVYLIDHRGIIRGKWKGDPDDLDAEIEKLVKKALDQKEKEEPKN